MASREKEALERNAEVEANKAVVEPALERIYPGARRNRQCHNYPLPLKDRIMPAAIAELAASGRTVEAEVRHQIDDIKRAPGVTTTSVKDLEPMLVQSGIAIDLEIREENRGYNRT